MKKLALILSVTIVVLTYVTANQHCPTYSIKLSDGTESTASTAAVRTGDIHVGGRIAVYKDPMPFINGGSRYWITDAVIEENNATGRTLEYATVTDIK